MRALMIFAFVLSLLFISAEVLPQTDTVFNHTDAGNMKQGFWKKSYPNGKLMYKGFFKDNKPAGEMRRYFESGALKAILDYDKNGIYADARLFYENGKPAATGKYFNSLKDGEWTYFSFYDKSVTARENYIKGIRNGISVMFYDNGDISEKIEWKNNMKSGIWEQYFKGNIPKLKATFAYNKLEGEFLVYYTNGKPYLTGLYKDDLREGRWTFYNEDGTTQKVLDYHSGKAAGEEKLDAKQQEFFRQIDEAKGKFNEPDETDFIAPAPR